MQLLGADESRIWLARTSNDEAVKNVLREDIERLTGLFDEKEGNLREQKTKLERSFLSPEKATDVYDNFVDIMSPLELKLQREKPLVVNRQSLSEDTEFCKVLN